MDALKEGQRAFFSENFNQTTCIESFRRRLMQKVYINRSVNTNVVSCVAAYATSWSTVMGGASPSTGHAPCPAPAAVFVPVRRFQQQTQTLSVCL